MSHFPKGFRIKHDEIVVKFNEAQVVDAADRLDVKPDVVQDVIDALNDVLLSDPVGTIRRCSDGTRVACRVPSLNEPYEVMWVNCRGGGMYSDPNLNVVNWPIVWTPSPGDKVPNGRDQY